MSNKEYKNAIFTQNKSQNVPLYIYIKIKLVN